MRQTQTKGAREMNGYTTNNETLYFVDYHPYGLPSMVHTLNVWASDVLDAKNKFWDETPYGASIRNNTLILMSSQQKEQKMNGYRREENGTLEIIEVHNVDGELFAGMAPLTKTDEIADLMGWPDNGEARVYKTDGGIDVLIPQSAHAVRVISAECIGKGKDRFKRVNGITKDVKAKIEFLEKKHGPLTILVDSHTFYQGQRYKKAIQAPDGSFVHRQINDSDYIIVDTI
jgi:hypothetical protein